MDTYHQIPGIVFEDEQLLESNGTDQPRPYPFATRYRGEDYELRELDEALERTVQQARNVC